MRQLIANDEKPLSPKRFVSERVISEATGRSVRTLQKDRLLGRGPFPYYKINRQVAYDLAECLRIIEASRVIGGAA